MIFLSCTRRNILQIFDNPKFGGPWWIVWAWFTLVNIFDLMLLVSVNASIAAIFSNSPIIFQGKYSSDTIHENERVSKRGFFHFLICFVWNRKALSVSSLNWADNCSGQWWRTSMVLNTGNTTLSWNTGTSLKYHLILYRCTLIMT